MWWDLILDTMLAHNQRHWIQKLPVVHILQHLRPLSWVLRPGYHSELTLGNVIISVISFYYPVGIYHLLWAIFNVHSVDGFHEVIVDFQCLLIRTKLLAKLRFYQRSKKRRPGAPEGLARRTWRTKPQWCKPLQISAAVWAKGRRMIFFWPNMLWQPRKCDPPTCLRGQFLYRSFPTLNIQPHGNPPEMLKMNQK